MKLWALLTTLGLVFIVSPLLGYLAWTNPQFPPNGPYLLGFTSALAALHLGAAALFFLGLKNFTAELKTAYRIFCAGIIVFAVSELQLPIGTLYGLEDSTWFSSGLIVPIVGGVCLIFAGVKRLTKLFGVVSIWSSSWFVAGISIAAGVAGYFLPMGPPSATEQVARGTMALISLVCVVLTAAAILALKARHLATPKYQKALLWFFFGLAGLATGTFINVIAYMTIGSAHWFLLYGHTVWIETIFSFALLKAAYAFNTIEQEATATQKITTMPLVDVVIAAASKTSNTAAVDPFLDSVRVITARLTPGTQPSAEDQATLMRVYKSIEQYLVEHEPVRRYSKDELRQKLARDLKLSDGAHFFDSIDQASLPKPS